MRPVSYRLSIFFLVATSLLGATFLWLGYTNNGLKIICKTAQILTPGLKIEGLSGTFSSPLKISRVEFDSKDLHVIIDGFFLHWQPSSLFQARLAIEGLSTEGVYITLKTKDEDNGPHNTKELKDIFNLPVELDVKKLQISNLSWRQHNAEAILFRDTFAIFSIKEDRLDLRRFTTRFDNQPLSVELKGSFDFQSAVLPFHLSAKIRYPDPKKKRHLTALISAVGDTKDLALIMNTKGWVTGRLKANVFSCLSNPSWDVSVAIKEADLTHLNKDTPVKFSALKGHSKGSSRAFDLTLSGLISSNKIPVDDFLLSATGHNGMLKLSSLVLHGLNGEIVAKGVLNTEKGFAWRISAILKAMDPSVKWPKWKGRISGQLTSSGHVAKGMRPRAEIHINEIYGTLNNKEIHVAGALSLEGNRYTLPRLEIKSGKTTGVVSGWFDAKQADLNGYFESPDLSDMVPGLKGYLKIRGTLKGALNAPGINFSCIAKKVDSSIFSSDLIEASLKTGEGLKGELFARIKSKGLRLKGLEIGNVNLRLDGTGDHNTLYANVYGRQIDGRLFVKGHIDGLNKYAGSIRQLRLSFKGQRWTMVMPTGFIISRQGVVIKGLCMKELERDSKICLDLQRTRGQKMLARLRVRRFALEEISGLLTHDFKITGLVSGTVELRKDVNGGMKGFFNLETRPRLQLSWVVASGVRTIDLSEKLRGRIGERGLAAKLDITFDQIGTVTANVELPGWTYPNTTDKAQALAADVKIDLDQLDFIEAFIPQITQLKGRARAHVSLSGSTSRIKLGGNGSLSSLAFEVPALGISLWSQEIKLWSQTGDIRFSGRVNSGGGMLDISGSVTRLRQSWETKAMLKGSRFLASNTPQLKAYVSPDISLKIEKENLFLDGRLSIPEARINPQGFEKDAILPSADLVIERPGEKKRSNDLNIHADIKVSLGKHVKFDGFGLKGRLEGEIRLIELPEQPVLADGALFIKDATFNLYGTDLQLTKGRFLYSSTPIDSPEVELEAVRQTGDITAGFRIRGSIKEPVLSLFSQPSLPESEILSFLVGGGGEVSRSKSGAAIAGAANIIASRIKRFLGLEELRVKSGHTTRDLSILIGTYLTPKLYVQFINDIGENMTTLKLKYSLTKRIEIQSESGQNPSADIFLKFER